MTPKQRATYEKLATAAQRERLAARAMQGMLSNPNWQKDQVADPKRLAVCARIYADALTKELRKKPK